MGLEVSPREAELAGEREGFFELGDADDGDSGPSVEGVVLVVGFSGVSKVLGVGLPVGVAAPGDAGVESVVSVSWEYVPASGIRCCKECFHLSKINPFTKQLLKTCPEAGDACFVDFIIKGNMLCG